MSRIVLLLAMPVLFLVSGCASIVEGTSQTISFGSNPPGADCALTREGRVISSFRTPSGIVVEKSKHDIHIACDKEGYQTATNVLTSEIEGATFGNIVLGGFVGWAIDSASGADNKYAEQITVTLVPEERPAPAPMSSDTPAAPVAGRGGYGVLLASFFSREVAERTWPQYVEKYADLAAAEPHTQEVKGEDGAVRFNLYGAGLSQSVATNVCDMARSRDEYCSVVKL